VRNPLQKVQIVPPGLKLALLGYGHALTHRRLESIKAVALHHQVVREARAGRVDVARDCLKSLARVLGSRRKHGCAVGRTATSAAATASRAARHRTVLPLAVLNDLVEPLMVL
jgi:hypothetical protein